MDFISQATNVSNWTLSLVLGAQAALQSGLQGGIVGELPICDVLLATPWMLESNVERGTDQAPRKCEYEDDEENESSALMKKSNGNSDAAATGAANRGRRYGATDDQGGSPMPSSGSCRRSCSSESTESHSGSEDQKDAAATSGALLIGFDTWWSRMMIKSLQSKHLDFTHLLLLKNEKDVCGCCKVATPRIDVLPKMFYGLADEVDTPAGGGGDTKNCADSGLNAGSSCSDLDLEQPLLTTYKTVHRSECLLGNELEDHACEFFSSQLKEHLLPRYKCCDKGSSSTSQDVKQCKANEFVLPSKCTGEERPKTYGETRDFAKVILDKMCESVLACEFANRWDKRIIYRIKPLLEWSLYLQADVTRKNETMDRIYSRLPGMLRRLELKKFELVEGRYHGTYDIEDVMQAFMVYFGIMRACLISDKIYDKECPALMFTGYNVETGHQIVEDISEIPSQEQVGYKSEQVIESSQQERFIDKEMHDHHMYSVLLFDTLLSLGIMTLSGLGPVLSMYTARKMSSSYRESTMGMGTSMRWSISRIFLYNTGTARDDWMVCIIPAPSPYQWRMCMFMLLALTASIVPFVWWFFLDNANDELNNVTATICACSCAVAASWVVAAALSGRSEVSTAWTTFHVLCCFVFISFTAGTVFGKVENSEWYVYGLEAIYSIQWLIGEVSDTWLHESTALFMLGVVGAIRFSTHPDMD